MTRVDGSPTEERGVDMHRTMRTGVRRHLRRLGLSLSAAGVGLLALAAVGAGTGGVIQVVRASTGPPCGANELCIKQSQVPTTAQSFSGGSCGDLVSAHPTEDLWHFVIPSGASFDANASHFTAIFSSGQVHADSIGGPSNEMAYAYSPAGATLTWAFATNVNGTATQGYFVLSGTCPASQTSSSSTTTTTSKSSSPTSTTTTTSHAVTTSTSSPAGGVLAISTTKSDGGVAGLIVAPNTGAGGSAMNILAAVALLVTGTTFIGVARPRRGR
jgi:hypothetical protein